MMIILTTEERQVLKKRHRTERDGRIRDRIKAVVLHAEGWSNVQIAQALLIHVDTVGEHLEDYGISKKLKPENGGSESRLDAAETKELAAHIEEKTYTKVADICAHVKEVYGASYTVPGMTNWLQRQGFSYKQPKGVPAKADAAKQAIFISEYQKLMNETPEEEPILFGDGVHPTMATKLSYGWIRKGQDKCLPTTASRTRVNLFGALNLATMSAYTTSHDTIDSKAMSEHFSVLRAHYPNAPKIHIILDQGPYNKSKETREAAENHNIVLHFLPPYSPNLNPIERLWKIMNEHVRNNRFFKSAADFRAAIQEFFATTWPQIAGSMVDRVNDNFQTLKPVSSS
jgi:transposase